MLGLLRIFTVQALCQQGDQGQSRDDSRDKRCQADEQEADIEFEMTLGRGIHAPGELDDAEDDGDGADLLDDGAVRLA